MSDAIPSIGKAEPNEFPSRVVIALVALVFFIVFTWASYARWANFDYRTFDLAYYVQAIWQLIHGRFQVSVENVPLLGNHVEPIVFLFAPILALCRHPMVFVVVQNAALAAMGPIGYDISRRLGFDGRRACLLGAVLLLAPATGYVALHEFHPEALTAPLLLLVFRARLSNSLPRHWLWFCAVLACKENMALLLVAYAVVQSVVERRRGWIHIRDWYVWPGISAVAWFVLATTIITPALNAGGIDYLALYNRLGSSLGEILHNAIAKPQLPTQILFHALFHGNLLWGLLWPWLFLPLLRPRWLIVCAPVFLQHLFSWRSSEWTIFFHYAAPLIPVLWIAMAEGLAVFRPLKVRAKLSGTILLLVVVVAVVGQICLGSAAAVFYSTKHWFADSSDRVRKNAFLAQIPDQASVAAQFPYLSHLAMREKLISLHYVLKGLKTLGRQPFPTPAPTDFVLIDYEDSATFDAGAGFYHPEMKTVNGDIVQSSDQLLHNFLKQAAWTVQSRDELTLLQQRPVVEYHESARSLSDEKGLAIGNGTQLIRSARVGSILSLSESVEIKLKWAFQGDRKIFPWMLLRLKNENHSALLVRGLCAPEAVNGVCEESWHVTGAKGLPAGDYTAEAFFLDNTRRAWFQATGGGDLKTTLLVPPVPLGLIRVR